MTSVLDTRFRSSIRACSGCCRRLVRRSDMDAGVGPRPASLMSAVDVRSLLIRSSSRIGQGWTHRPLRGSGETVAAGGGYCSCGTPLLYSSLSHRRTLRIHRALVTVRSSPADKAAPTLPTSSRRLASPTVRGRPAYGGLVMLNLRPSRPPAKLSSPTPVTPGNGGRSNRQTLGMHRLPRLQRPALRVPYDLGHAATSPSLSPLSASSRRGSSTASAGSQEPRRPFSDDIAGF